MAKQWVATAEQGPDNYELVDVGVPAPGPGEVTVRVTAAGVNPVDLQPAAFAGPQGYPAPVGLEAAGVVTAVGEGASIGGKAVTPGDAVIVHPFPGLWASEVTVPTLSVLAKPVELDDASAANLLGAGTTAAGALEAVRAARGERILVHGASGAVGLSIVQQAAALGIEVVGTASPANADLVARFGATPVAYGEGLVDRLRDLGVEFDAAIDCVGTDEAVDVSLEILGSKERFLTIAAFPRAFTDILPFIAGNNPESASYRLEARQRLVDMAADGTLQVPVAQTFALADARDAMALLASRHPGGKIALIP